MAIRNILGALGGMLNRGPDQEDPTLTPEERERRRRLMMANRTPLNQQTATPLQTGGGLDQVSDRMKDAAKQARMGRLEGIAQERSADALSQPTGELDLNRIASTEQFAEPELPPEDVKSPYEPSGKGTQDNPYVIEETVVEGDAPDEEEQEEKQGLLGRLGGMVKSNPELFAQIAQLGGGLISGMAQDKAQRRADATTQDRMARANLIGALTGRTPQVAAERADTGGLFSLDTLGKAIKGGGALAQDEIGRREAQEQLEYDRGIAEEETEYQREQDRLDRKESEEKLEQGWANIEQGGLKGATALKNKAAIMKGSVDVVDSFLDNLENYQKLEEGDSISWRRMLGGLATNFGIVGTTYNPEAQQYTDSRALIVAEVARIINGGGANVSAKEQQMAESVVPDIRIPRDTQAYGIQKLKRLREILSLRVNAINEGINPTSSLYDQIVFDEAEGQETETEPTEEEVAMQGKDLTPDERDLLRRAMANPDDTEVQSAVNNNPKLKKAIGRG